mmetsp:Transcript_7872/g.11647  ORF Transcript_7872/g.11647 Transcript_7872/m.11647 type:complete len:113 (+) Transcript_7872:101-439(+)
MLQELLIFVFLHTEKERIDREGKRIFVQKKQVVGLFSPLIAVARVCLYIHICVSPPHHTIMFEYFHYLQTPTQKKLMCTQKRSKACPKKHTQPVIVLNHSSLERSEKFNVYM